MQNQDRHPDLQAQRQDQRAGAFDREGVDVIYSETFDEQGIGMALMNRLRKAAQKG